MEKRTNCEVSLPLESRIEIRFQNQAFVNLRKKLLLDLENEYFACLLAKKHIIQDLQVFTVIEAIYPSQKFYKQQGKSFLGISTDFIRNILVEVDSRIDIDTIIDVHTHPFSNMDAWFSSIDDLDERNFALYLKENFHQINYASLVLSKTSYKARVWEIDKYNKIINHPAIIKTQKICENIVLTKDSSYANEHDESVLDEMFDRSVLALGLENMRRFTSGQKITIVGVGGIGSIIAEHLIHMGFNYLNLIDFDALEISNLNRIVGASYDDAKNSKLKVEAVSEYLTHINPKATINIFPFDVSDKKIEYVLADSDWIMVATDNYASRFHIQELAFKYYVPFITAGVNITVEDGKILDMSGEVILIRMGDRVCLSCLGRMNYNEIARDIHPDMVVREGLVAKGYVTGKDVKEPAVKTLNTYIATMAVDTLVNQYIERRPDATILVYEDNAYPTIYEDKESVENRNLNCSVCNI